jgi:hypothetical protein
LSRMGLNRSEQDRTEHTPTGVVLSDYFLSWNILCLIQTSLLLLSFCSSKDMFLPFLLSLSLSLSLFGAGDQTL